LSGAAASAEDAGRNEACGYRINTLLRAEVEQTVARPSEVDDELRVWVPELVRSEFLEPAAHAPKAGRGGPYPLQYLQHVREVLDR
jgi:hypothetical protein